MDVTIIGASGDVGTETVTQLLADRVLTPSERLQLVGRVEGKSSSCCSTGCSSQCSLGSRVTEKWHQKRL